MGLFDSLSFGAYSSKKRNLSFLISRIEFILYYNKELHKMIKDWITLKIKSN
jgi:hypothetical protein